jgi:hypothetical protein
MASKFTHIVNQSNVKNIRQQIARKKESTPYHATVTQSVQVLTDYDTFPYPRYYRGVPDSTVPIIAEREAGWRPRHDTCYSVVEPNDVPLYPEYPNNCFQAACSTVFPCYPEYASRYADLEAMNVFLNNKCIVQYR